MNHNAITGWIVAAVTVIGLIGGAVLYIGNINGKLITLDNDLRELTRRIDGLYIYIAEQGGNVKKAVLSSDLNDASKKQIIDSFLPMDARLKPKMNEKEIKN